MNLAVLRSIERHGLLSRRLKQALMDQALREHNRALMLHICRHWIKGAWPEAEPALAGQAWSAAAYAMILQDRFPLGERTIAHDVKIFHSSPSLNLYGTKILGVDFEHCGYWAKALNGEPEYRNWMLLVYKNNPKLVESLR